ncbi:MAG: CoA pyrophosphatase [Bacteroidales bacterium]|nr:CoA pyrophosphatase [Bacteroidales bacterium]
MDFKLFVDSLKLALTETLPGKEIQYKMASNRRLLDIQPDENTKDSSVLILLYHKENDIYSVLMKRPDSNDPHGGQISLPGGRYEENDTDLIATALREAREEVGINDKNICVIGTLTNLYIPVSNYNVLPVVAYTSLMPEFTISRDEVDYIIEFKLSRLFDNNIIKTKDTNYKGYPLTIRYFEINNNAVWGATAMILNELIEIIKSRPVLLKTWDQ